MLARAALGPQRPKVAVAVRPEDDSLAVEQGVVDRQ